MKIRTRFLHAYVGRSYRMDEPFELFVGVGPRVCHEDKSYRMYEYFGSLNFIGGRLPYFQRFYNHGWSIEVDRVWSGAWTGRYWEIVGWVLPIHFHINFAWKRLLTFNGVEWRFH